MFEYLEKVRQKDEKSKKRIAFYCALAFSLVLFLLWLTVSLPQIKSKKIERDAVSETTKSPVTNFMDALSNGVMEIQKSLSEVKAGINMFSSSTAYYVASSSLDNSTSSPEKSE